MIGGSIMPLNAVTSSVISSILERKNILVSATDLEFLDALETQVRPLTITEISTKFKLDENLVKELVSELKSKALVDSNSPKYKISERGRKLVELVRAIAPHIEKVIMQDTYIRILSQSSRSFVE